MGDTEGRSDLTTGAWTSVHRGLYSILVTGRFLCALLLVITASCHSVAVKQSPRALNAHGIWCAHRELWEEAKYWWEQALNQDPQNASAINNLAVAAERAKEYRSARELYDRARVLAPNQRKIRKNASQFQVLLRSTPRGTEKGQDHDSP